MSYTLSKAVREGTLVTKHGSKLIRLGRNRKPMGVWTNGGRRTTITLGEERIVTDLPMGVITWGPAFVKVKGDLNAVWIWKR